MSDETLPREELLRKMLNMTTSDNDGQALVAIRKANALLSAAGWDWDKLLAGKIKIIESPFKNMPNPTAARRVEQPPPPPAPATSPQRKARPGFVPRAGYMWEYNPAANDWFAVPASAPPPPHRPFGLNLSKKNLYGGHCYCCGDYTNSDAGFIMKPDDFCRLAPSKWAICCKDCNTQRSPSSVPRAPAPKQTGQTTVHAPAPNLGSL